MASYEDIEKLLTDEETNFVSTNALGGQAKKNELPDEYNVS
jgi:hypothetical protein